MKKLAIFMTILLGFSFTPHSSWNTIPSSGKSYHTIEKDIDKLVREAMGKEIPGLTVAVSKKGKMVYSKGFGYANFEKKTKMKRFHKSRIGSVSKILTALGIMKLTEEKEDFDINRKVYFDGGVLPQQAYRDAIKKGAKKYNKPKSWYKSMRLKHLLSHTVGYDWSGDRPGAAQEFGLPEDDITYGHIHQFMLMDRELTDQPGTKYQYSNHALGLCGHIINSTTDVPYGIYIDEKILQPLGLSGKIVKNKKEWDKNDAYPHRYDEETKKIETLDWEETEGGLSTVSAAGGWSAAAESMIRLMVATDKRANHKDILKKETIDLMEKRPYPNVSNSHAIGWGYGRDGLKLSHGGSIKGGRAYIVKFKEGLISTTGVDLSDINVAICANARPFDDIQDLANAIARVVGAADIPKSYDLLNDISGKFVGVWKEQSSEDRVWVGADWENFKDKNKEFRKAGYRLVDVDTYQKNGRRLYNGVWEKGGGKFGFYQFDSWDKFVDKWKALNKDGLRLIDVETFKSGSKRFYVGVWKGGKGNKALYQYDSWNKFTAQWKKLNEQGLRLIDIETFKSGNKRHYVGVWRAGKGNKGLLQLKGWKKFNEQRKLMNKNGQRLIDVEMFKVGDKRHYIGVWRAGEGDYAFWHDADWNHFKAKREEFAKDGKYLVDMERL